MNAYQDNKMFKNKITQVSVDDIIIDRNTRQRSELTFDSVLSLAVSIARSQWISPILVDQNTNYLIAGERRLTAVKALRAATEGDYSNFSDQADAREILFPVCTCQVESWKGWTKIPAQLGGDFTATDLAMFEFVENAQRQDLPWQDRAKAIYDIYCKGLAEYKDWTAVQTANIIGVNKGIVTESLRVWRLQVDEDTEPEAKAIIKESQSLRAAVQALERYTSRRGLDVSLVSGGSITARPKADKPIYTKPGPAPFCKNEKTYEPDYEEPVYTEPATLADRLIQLNDFNTWAHSYTGEPFNFIHCDFPYGISFNTGEFTTGIRNTILGDYDDSVNVYWQLLNTLQDNSHIIAQQAHIMFWFSQNLRRETEDFFTAMGGFVQPFLMIWHCGNDGLIPDMQRYGRRTYETAMLVTFGDRKIVAPRALSIDNSRESNSRIHRSQKPLRVLNHFFEMFVDSSSFVLDPTCGSGTSLIAAYNLKAQKVLGLENDPNIYANTCNYVNSMAAKVAL
jgi:ParB-like chromosome segregation protein Spo0J